MNSSNSSKPPSTDGFNKPKPKSLRVKTGRRAGGQTGHQGHNIELPHEPDEVIDHLPPKCAGCPNLVDCASGGVFRCGESRYVIDAVMTTRVTEHRRMVADCPLAAAKQGSSSEEPASGSFPEDLTAHIQYGDSFVVVAGLLNTFGAVSDIRTSRLLRSFFDVTISPGTVVSMTSRCAGKVSDVLGSIRERLLESKVNNADETGMPVNGRICWNHIVCNPGYTLQTLSRKRGTEGMDESGILQNYDGTLVHDCWPSYWKYDSMRHAVCNAHILRELNGIEEQEPGHTWPG